MTPIIFVLLGVLAVACALCGQGLTIYVGVLIMGKIDAIIVELQADRDAVKAARAADAAKSDALSQQVADLKNQLANVATDDQLNALQSVADDLKAIGTDPPAAPPAAPASPATDPTPPPTT